MLQTKYTDYKSIEDLKYIFVALDRDAVSIRDYNILKDLNPDLVKNMTPIYRSMQLKKVGPPKEILISYRNPIETYREI